MKYKIRDRVKTSTGDKEGTVMATDDREDEYSKVKVRFDGILEGTEWWFESMLDGITTTPKGDRRGIE